MATLPNMRAAHAQRILRMVRRVRRHDAMKEGNMKLYVCPDCGEVAVVEEGTSCPCGGAYTFDAYAMLRR